MSYAMQPAVCHDVMVIDHYFTKSAEEWAVQAPPWPRVIRSIRMVTGCSQMSKQQATVEDTRALRFLPRLRALLET